MALFFSTTLLMMDNVDGDEIKFSDWEVLEIIKRKSDAMDIVKIPSNIGYFRDLISSTLSEDHRMALRDTPFYGYLDIPNVPMQPLLVDCLLEAFDVAKSSFKIGGKWTSFGVEDVVRITGLSFGGSIVDTRFHRSDRETLYKLVLSYRTKAEVEEDLKRRTRRGKKQIDEGKKNIVCARRNRMGELIMEMAKHRDPLLPQMLVAFIIGFILCPQANMGCPLFAFRYAENLDTLNEYNWVEVVYNALRTEMSKAQKIITKRSKGKRSKGCYMGGFASILVIWFYELAGKLSLREGAESLPPILSFKKCPKSLRRNAMQELIRDPINFRKCDNDSRALKFQKRISEAATTTATTPAATATAEAGPTKSKGKVITEADLDRLIDEKRVELDLLLKMKREIFGGRQDDVDSDGGDDDDGDDGDDSDGGDDDGGNEEDDRDVGDEGDGGEVDEDAGGDAEVGGDVDVDKMNVDKDDGGDDANFEVDMVSMEVDDDAFVLSPRDLSIIEGKRKTPSIKRTVLSRSRQAGPTMRSPFVPLASRKGVPSYPGRKEVNDNERELLDNFWKDKNMTMETLVWTSSDALLTRKDALELLKGDAISCDAIASYVVLLNELMELQPDYAKDIHICSPWITRCINENNASSVERVFRPITRIRFLELDKIIFPLLTSFHWHMLVLSVKDKRFYHYSSLRGYMSDAVNFRVKLISSIPDEWNLDIKTCHEIESVNVPQQRGLVYSTCSYLVIFLYVLTQKLYIAGGKLYSYTCNYCTCSSLDCGVFLMSYIFSLVSDQTISIDQKDCARHRARIVALFLSEGNRRRLYSDAAK